MIEAFIESDDHSETSVNKIEGFVIEHFYEDEEFQDLLVALASYSPNGGEFLYDEKQITNIFKTTLESL